MVKNGSHIDVLFREGLRNTEVLPPASVWENIQPVIRKKSSNAFFYRVAAGIAVLTSLGLLAYFYLASSLEFDSRQNRIAGINNLSTLYDASYIDIAVREKQETKAADNNYYVDRAGSSTAANADEEDFSADPASKRSPVTVNLAFETADNNIAGMDRAASRLPARSGPSVNYSAELFPVDPDPEEEKIKRWELGAMFSPTYLSTSFNAGSQAVAQITENENAVLSYTGGVSLSFRMNSRLSVQTGLYYSSLGRQVTGVNSYAGFEPFANSKSGQQFAVETSSGTVSSTNNDIYLADAAGNRVDGYFNVDNFDPVKENLNYFGDRLRQNFEYLEVPLMVRYKLIDRKMDFNIMGGMSYNFLVGNQTWAMNSEGAKKLIGATEDVDMLLLSSSLGMSMEYNLTERLSLNLEPQVRYFLNTGGELGSGNPYTFGVFSGMHLRF